MTRLGSSIVIAVGLLPMIACSSADGPTESPPGDAAGPRPDAPSDARPEAKPLTACDADAEPIDLGVTEPVVTNTFYASAFYVRTASGYLRKRLGGSTQLLIGNGQSYPRLGATATLLVRDNTQASGLVPPGGGLGCGPSVLLPFQLEYRTTSSGTFEGVVVLLVDDLTHELTHVLASRDTYDGEVVKRVSIVSQDGACGRLVLNVELASGRTLLVLREPQGPQLRTLLTIAAPSGPGLGQAIDGTTDRFLGALTYVGALAGDQLTFTLAVENGAKARLGLFAGSLDLRSGKITCRITDSDIPCTTRRPPLGQYSQAWAQAGDTAVSADSVLTVVRGDRVAQEIGAGFTAQICAATGEVYFSRQFHDPGFDPYVDEVYVLRQSGAIERVTRNLELALAGGAYATNADGFRVTDKCDVIQNLRKPGGGTPLAIYWVDGTFALMPIEYPYVNVGYEGDSGLPMVRYDGGAMIIRKPSGQCTVPADVFPAPTR